MRKKIIFNLIIMCIFACYYFYPPYLLIHLIAIIICLLSKIFTNYKKYFFVVQFIVACIDPYTTIWLSFYIDNQFYYPILSVLLFWITPTDYSLNASLLFLISSVIHYYENYTESLIDSYTSKRDSIKKENISLHEFQNKIILAQQEERNVLLAEERNRISMELHDQSGHNIASTIMQISVLKTKENDPIKKEILSTIQENLSNAMANIRSILHNEIILNDIEKELTKLTQLYSSLNSSIKINLKGKLPESVVNHLSSISKEAFTNTIKHSNAKNVVISLIESDSYYLYNYKDDGTSKIKQEVGIGLYSMQVRANKMKAKLTIMDDYSIHIRIPKGEQDENMLY